MKITTSIVLGLLFMASCNSVKKSFFSRQSPREKYVQKLKDAGLETTLMAMQWKRAAQKALDSPLSITLPYRETGYFASESPSATGLQFPVKRGQKIFITCTENKDSASTLFLDVYEISSNKKSLLASAEKQNDTIQLVVKSDGNWQIVIQAGLLETIEYSIDIYAEPSLAFPVAKSGSPKIISTWGTARDGGARSHEGIDISAKFRSPVIAAADGDVARVALNNLGGKVVFARDASSGNMLYYAHLDSQIATPGQRIKAGDTIGLIGNTGNARNTIPHLHFGIYTFSGAIDPLAFVQPVKNNFNQIAGNLSSLNKWLHVTSASNVFIAPDEKSMVFKKLLKNDVIKISAATGNFYKVVTADSLEGFLNFNNASAKFIQVYTIEKDVILLNDPAQNQPGKALIKSESEIKTIGYFKNYALVNWGHLTGWISREEL